MAIIKVLPKIQRHHCGRFPIMTKGKPYKESIKLECPCRFVAVSAGSELRVIKDWNRFYGNE